MIQSTFRLRVAWSKQGRLAFLSHLEVARALERVIRRAGLPYALSQGFNPHMRIAFGPALGVGMGGDTEYFDVWLTDYTPAQDVLTSLRDASPTDLVMQDASYVALSDPSISAALTVSEYLLEMEGDEACAASLRDSIDGAVRTGSIAIEHKGKVRDYDLAESLYHPPRVDHTDGIVRIWFTIRSGAQGSLRPERFFAAVAGGAPLLRSRRTGLFMVADDGTLCDGFGQEVR